MVECRRARPPRAEGELDGIRLDLVPMIEVVLTVARLADGRAVIDVHAEENVW